MNRMNRVDRIGRFCRRSAAIAADLLLLPLTVNAAEPPRELAIEMGAPFADNAVLQREMPVPAWGWSKPGTKITVEFAPRQGSGQAGQKKSATAGKDGKWMLELDELKASSEPAEMVISDSNGKKETLKNILVGEVWMASGQSNMQWPANKCIVGRKLIPEIMARVKAGEEKMPVIREGKVTNVFSSLYPTERAKGQWSSSWGNFSAIAFAFAYDLAKEVGVPIGIVNCAFSTTQIQAWIPREGFEGGTDEYTKAIYQKVLESDHRTPEHKAAWERYYQSLRDWAKESAERTKKGLSANTIPSAPGALRGNRDACWMYNGKIHPMVPYAIRGAVWNQGYANMNEGIVYRNNLHSLVRGWRTVWGKPDLPVYFHQFYAKGGNDGITLNSTAEMWLGTWLAAKEIPNANMASQIDITGGVHYYNKAVPGQRLARHALKNQYGKKIIANGPMYKSYKVKGGRLILGLDHADALVVGKSSCGSSFATPKVIENGEEQVTLFYLADQERVWHQAKVKIDGEKIVLTAPGLGKPCGVAYGLNGVGALPGIYNRAMLPLTPFIYYEHKLVTSDTWPMDHIKIAGKVIDPTTYGAQYEHRKLWLLSTQFRNNGVIQADVPTRVYGKALPNSVVKFSFAGTDKSITLGAEESHWEIAVPALPASAEPKTMHVTCELDGVLMHERNVTNIVVGDVWYVSLQDAKSGRPRPEPATGDVRMLTPFANKRTDPMPNRYKLNASGYPKSRYYARWTPPRGFAKELGERIFAKTGKPVGIVIMNTRSGVPIKRWVGYEWLKQAPAWKADMDELYSRYAPDPKAYFANAETFIADWKAYWKKNRADHSESGGIPRFPAGQPVTTSATMTYNMLVTTFSPGNFKGIICLTPESFCEEGQGADFGPKFSIMANCWKETFARGKEVLDPHFFYALPNKELAPKITKPMKIKGKSTAVEAKTNAELIELAVREVYR